MDGNYVIEKRGRFFSLLEILIICLLAIVPLFMSFPYRVNIFLSWEGAYRLSQGQIPFKDFGMPLGYMYWVVPAVFFKIFGTQMITLVKAQVFINIVSGFAFRSILKSLRVQPGVRLLSVLLYCISFSFFNFWPWYNHTVIVYEMVALAFLMRYVVSEKKSWILLSLSALFSFFSFFTKQDAGGLTCVLCIVLLAYYSLTERNWAPLLIYVVSLAAVAFAIITPLLRYNFSYWFNYGQTPHTARVSIFELVDEFLASSQWIKFYLVLIFLIVAAKYRNGRQIFKDVSSSNFLLLTLMILVEASVLQVTSYTPPDNNIFFHSFAIAYILSNLADLFHLDFYRLRNAITGGGLIVLWWSGVFWKYFEQVTQNAFARLESQKPTTENIVNRHTYLVFPSEEIPMNEWGYSKLKSFRRIYMPKACDEGIQRLLNNTVVKNNKNISVLNMTELTPLAVEMPFRLERGQDIPLWYHLGVGMFNKEAARYEEKIMRGYYDLVLFEYVPHLNNFYPFRVRDTLLNYYSRIDSFPAPRRGNTPGIIEVFVKNNL
ncbi:MAG: hypothetical protein ACXVPE_16870 [Bacteroidia bacterium]